MTDDGRHRDDPDSRTTESPPTGTFSADPAPRHARPEGLVPPRRADALYLGGFAVLAILLHLPVLHRYGYHHDELYFVACGRHLSIGYVDHAPLVPWIARLATELFGTSVFALRVFPMLAGAAAVFLTGLLARQLGGGRFAQAVACVATLIAPVYLRSANLLCISAFEPLFWIAASLVLARIVRRDEPRAWPWVGLIVGLGLLNKHSMLFFVFGLAVATILTPLRRHLRTPWPYVAGAIALALFVPNLVWQVRNDWPTAEFLRNLNENVMSGVSKVQFAAGQILYLNPLGAVVWIAGLTHLFRPAGKTYRVFGWLWLAVFGLLFVASSKIYYLAPAYPPLLAAGGVALERFARRRSAAWKPAVLGALALAGAVLAPVSLPVMSIDATDRYADVMTFGAFGNIYEITGDLHGMFGWPERVAAVADVYHALPAGERERAMLLAEGYGNAGAIDLLGPTHDLPAATSFAMTNWLWADPERSIDIVVGVGFSPEFLAQVFDEVEVAASVELEHVNPWSTPFVVTVCRRPKVPMAEVWPQVRPW